MLQRPFFERGSGDVWLLAHAELCSPARRFGASGPWTRPRGEDPKIATGRGESMRI